MERLGILSFLLLTLCLAGCSNRIPDLGGFTKQTYHMAHAIEDTVLATEDLYEVLPDNPEASVLRSRLSRDRRQLEADLQPTEDALRSLKKYIGTLETVARGKSSKEQKKDLQSSVEGVLQPLGIVDMSLDALPIGHEFIKIASAIGRFRRAKHVIHELRHTLRILHPAIEQAVGEMHKDLDDLQRTTNEAVRFVEEYYAKEHQRERDYLSSLKAQEQAMTEILRLYSEFNRLSLTCKPPARFRFSCRETPLLHLPTARETTARASEKVENLARTVSHQKANELISLARLLSLTDSYGQYMQKMGFKELHIASKSELEGILSDVKLISSKARGGMSSSSLQTDHDELAHKLKTILGKALRELARRLSHPKDEKVTLKQKSALTYHLIALQKEVKGSALDKLLKVYAKLAAERASYLQGAMHSLIEWYHLCTNFKKHKIVDKSKLTDELFSTLPPGRAAASDDRLATAKRIFSGSFFIPGDSQLFAATSEEVDHVKSLLSSSSSLALEHWYGEYCRVQGRLLDLWQKAAVCASLKALDSGFVNGSPSADFVDKRCSYWQEKLKELNKEESRVSSRLEQASSRTKKLDKAHRSTKRMLHLSRRSLEAWVQGHKNLENALSGRGKAESPALAATVSDLSQAVINHRQAYSNQSE